MIHRALAAEARSPISVIDHVEILYDIDIAFQKVAQELSLKLVRAESMNDSPLLIDALEQLVTNGEESRIVGEPIPFATRHF